MSIFDDKVLKSVADAVSKVLAQESEGTHPKSDKEKKLAALAHPKDKITHKDVLVGRGVLKKEEAEQLDELSKGTLGSYVNKATVSAGANALRSGYIKGSDTGHNLAVGKKGKQIDHSKDAKGAFDTMKKRQAGIGKAVSRLTREDVEQVEDEMLQEGFADMEKYMKTKSGPQPSGGAGKKQGSRYGGGKQAPEAEEDDEKEEKKPARGKYGARQNFKRSTRVNESFTDLIAAYNDAGLKGLQENLYVEEEILEEEPDNEQFTKELEDQKASMEGKKKQPSVAAPSTQGVKQMPEEYVEEDVEQLDELSKDTLSSYLQKRGQPGANPKGKPLNKSMYQAVTKYAKKVAKEEVEIDEEQLDEAHGKITHYLHKDDIEAHKDWVESEGYGTKTRALPKNHPLHKTHVGIVDTADSDYGYNSDYGTPVDKYKAAMKAKAKMKKEEFELDERTLTPGEKKEMEKNVKGMKKKLSGFKQRYGDRAKSVMYATATKMAKKD